MTLCMKPEQILSQPVEPLKQKPCSMQTKHNSKTVTEAHISLIRNILFFSLNILLNIRPWGLRGNNPLPMTSIRKEH